MISEYTVIMLLLILKGDECDEEESQAMNSRLE